ncbi:hypothetical protein GOP47_0018344 [Adiantum capillus-veneris]|uniref:Enoyl reductase (ER) domain-containing protein n=1 Tax=Adiantum capillus-veneris TaxID=13818 RepID=A0A9D4UI92_ADICA|nr:hypothetical protein GOP47_0017969 [Adiantum capillus-veneris]KAI5067816.1 hypothetical protein GOP47_0018344 [Adiantum capillus-veneris]
MEEASEAQVCGRGVEERIWKKEVVMVSRPQGMPVEANFEVRRSELVFQVPPPPGFLLVKVLWLSVDPYLREIMNEDNGLTVIPPFQIGQPVFAGSISKVLASSDPKFKEGNIVQTISPVADYALISSEFFSIDKIEHTHAINVPLNQYLGVLGFPGLTAWVGLNVITQLQANEEVFISAAAGAVGLLAGQLAKLKGCRVVGSAGTDEKVRVLKEVYHFDEAFNYKTEKDLNLTLKRYFPSGFDVYFENVGGNTLEAALENIRRKGRIIACGMISQYNKEYKEREGVRNLMHVIGKSLKMEGFMVGDYWHMRDDFIKEVGELLQQGKISYHMDILGRGIDEFTKAFVGLLGGKNIGKAVLLTDDGETP